MITKDQLNQGQSKALADILHAIDSKTHITLNGPAGTGKTTTTKILMDELKSRGTKGIILAAPTHAAKKVLTKLSGIKANTIHSVLKISPTNYEDQTLFEQADVPDLQNCKVLICDEASMYDRKLFHILLQSIPSTCTIIALGDAAQIRPVAPGEVEQDISPFFTHKDFQQIELTEVMRSNAPIIEVATKVRQGEWIYPHHTEIGGVYNFEGREAVKVFFEKYFSIVKTPNDLFENRLFAYTNKSVNQLNKIVRKKLYNTTDPIIVDEIIVLQEPITKMIKDPLSGKPQKVIVCNNGEFIRVLSISYQDFSPFIAGVSGGYMIRYARLHIETIDPDEEEKQEYIDVIYSENEQKKLDTYLHQAAAQLRGGARYKWKYWWDIKNKFTATKPLPACTIHKSQGSTIDNSFIFTPCIKKADDDLARQLLYVAVTRARHNVYFV